MMTGLSDDDGRRITILGHCSKVEESGKKERGPKPSLVSDGLLRHKKMMV